MPLLLLYLTLAFVRPFELFPALAPLHLMQVVGGLGILVTLTTAPAGKFSFQSKQLYLTLLFMFLIVLSPVVTQRWLGGVPPVLGEVAITTVVFLMVLLNVTDLRRVKMLLTLLSIVAVYLAVQSILAVRYGAFGDLLILEQRVSDFSDDMIVRVRATGFLADPNDLGQTLVMAIPFVALMWRKRALVRNVVLVVLPSLLLIYGVYLTHSRGAVVSLGLMAMIALSGALGKVAGAAIGVLGGLAAAALNFTGGRAVAATADGSTVGRLEAWSTGLQFLKSHPFFGIGYQQFAEHNGLTAHNSVVLCFAELGFPAFCVWVALLAVTILELKAVRQLKPSRPEDVELQRYARAIQLALYAFLTSAWFLSRTYVLPLYLLIAAGAAVADIARRSGKRIETPDGPRLASLSVAAASALVFVVYVTIKVSVR